MYSASMDRERAESQQKDTNETLNDEKHEQVDVSGTQNTQIKPGPIAVPKVMALNWERCAHRGEANMTGSDCGS